jgi:hypothetical protein
MLLFVLNYLQYLKNLLVFLIVNCCETETATFYVKTYKDRGLHMTFTFTAFASNNSYTLCTQKLSQCIHVIYYIIYNKPNHLVRKYQYGHLKISHSEM